MRDQWYGDKRNLVKWGTLVYLAKREGLATILQLAMYRPSDACAPLRSGNREIALPNEVLRHFRDLDDIQRLSERVGIRVDGFKATLQDTLMKTGAVLVCYQHARRNSDWRNDVRNDFSSALGIETTEVEVFDSELASDVALFSVKRK